MKIYQKLFMYINRFIDLSNRSHNRFAIIEQKVSTVTRIVKKKLVTQPAAKKTCENMPGTFCVLRLIQNSDHGVDPKTLKQTTGFNKQKVHKILHKLFAHGQIRIEGGGLYTGVKR